MRPSGHSDWSQGCPSPNWPCLCTPSLLTDFLCIGTGRLVVATPITLYDTLSGLVMSEVPFNGQLAVATKRSDDRYFRCEWLHLYLSGLRHFLINLGTCPINLNPNPAKYILGGASKAAMPKQLD